MELVRATLADAAAIHELLVDCGGALSAAGFENWNPPVGLERLQRDIAEREVYVARENGTLIATVMASLEPTVEYEADAAWQDGVARALYVNRLAVRPALQGSGMGGLLTNEMERRARELGCTCVRLDALSANGRLLEFYQRRGYQKRFEREHSGWQFSCMEKLL